MTREQRAKEWQKIDRRMGLNFWATGAGTLGVALAASLGVQPTALHAALAGSPAICIWLYLLFLEISDPVQTGKKP